MLKTKQIPDNEAYKPSANRMITLVDVGDACLEGFLNVFDIENIPINFPTKILVDYETYANLTDCFDEFECYDLDAITVESIVFITFDTIITEQTFFYKLEADMDDDDKRMWLVQMMWDAMGYNGTHFFHDSIVQNYMESSMPEYYDDRDFGLVYDLFHLANELDSLDDVSDEIFEAADHYVANENRDDIFEWAKHNGNYIQQAHDNFGELPSNIENAIQWGMLEEVQEIMGEVIHNIESMV